MIYGNGIDIQEISRIKEVQEKNPAFATRILTSKELTVFNTYHNKRKYEFLAGRFSAKESFSKAYGTGIGKKVNFKDVEILNDNQTGKPEIKMYPDKDKLRAKITISHSEEYVITEVILEKLSWWQRIIKIISK